MAGQAQAELDPIVGREAELARVTAFLAGRPRPGTLLIEGAPGVGKTTPDGEPLDMRAVGFVDQWINGNLPTQYNGGTYLGLNASATRVIQVVNGSNTVYLNGKSDCAAALLGPVTLTAVLTQSNPTSSIVTP